MPITSEQIETAKTKKLKRNRMKAMVSCMQKYWNLYTSQEGYERYTDQTFLNDALYGIGIAIDPKGYFAAQGFDRFKEMLKEHLACPDRWQQIETAPKNRTVLIFYKNECGKGRAIKSKYVGKHTVEHGDDDALDCDQDEFGNTWWPEGWYEEIDNWNDYTSVLVNYSPTHWMLLPKAPQG